MDFREFLALTEVNTVGKHNDHATGAMLQSTQTGSERNPSPGMEGHPNHLPSLDLVPTITKTSQIKYVEKNKNPIRILLADGTRLHFTWDEFKRIQGDEPTMGKTLTVVFQRFPSDTTEETSQIQSVRCY